MSKKRIGVTILSVLFMLSLAIGAHAQEISPEKRELIDELIEITEAKEQAEKITDIILLQLEKDYPETIRQIMPPDKLCNKEEQEKCTEKIVESYRRISKKFRELYPKRVNLGEVIEEIYYPLYDKYFTENDLRDLIEFYKSPIGRKFIRIMPDLLQESMQRSGEILNPMIIELINEILQEEKGYLMETA